MRPKTAHALRGPAWTLCDVIRNGLLHPVRLLVSAGLSLECRDGARRTPLMLCAFINQEEWGVSIARHLIENGVNVSRRDSFRRNALHYACIYEREQMVRVLLKAIDFDLNQADKFGNTALHYVAMSGNVSIAQTLAQSFKKYKISGEKTNHLGRRAYEEALCAGNTACAHTIQFEINGRRPGSAVKDVRFADEIPVSTTFNRADSPLVKKRILRPSSGAFLTRHDSCSSLNSVEDKRSNGSFRSRSSLSMSFGVFTRRSKGPLYSNGYKNDEEIINCVPENDFRNKPDYVFKLVHMPFEPDFWDPMSLLDSSTRGSMTWTDTCSVAQSHQALVPGGDWRHELKMLFKVYENQCTPSWRNAIKKEEEQVQPVEHDPSCPGPEEDEKGRKGRRQSIPGKALPELRRRQSTIRLRRMGSATSNKGPCAMDASLDTSSESVNSMASNKKRNSEKETPAGRPDSYTSKQVSKGTSPKEVSSPPSSPSPTLAVPVSKATAPPSSRPSSKSSNAPNHLASPSNTRRRNSKSLQSVSDLSGEGRSGRESSGMEAKSSVTRNSKMGDARLRDKYKDGIDGPQHKISVPELKETLVSDALSSNHVIINQQDANKLSVYNPYESEEDVDDDGELEDVDY